jgi:hypothetical protein
MKRLYMLVFLILAMQFSPCCRVDSCPAAEPKKDEGFYQKVLDHALWSWSDDEAGIFYSMTQSGFGYQIELIRPPGGTDALTIRFMKDAKVICSWNGHPHSVFVQKDNTLVYALFYPSQQGCTLVAVNLDSGAERWRTNLQAIDTALHSGYNNLINMNAADGIIVVHGK